MSISTEMKGVVVSKNWFESKVTVVACAAVAASTKRAINRGVFTISLKKQKSTRVYKVYFFVYWHTKQQAVHRVVIMNCFK